MSSSASWISVFCCQVASKLPNEDTAEPNTSAHLLGLGAEGRGVLPQAGARRGPREGHAAPQRSRRSWRVLQQQDGSTRLLAVRLGLRMGCIISMMKLRSARLQELPFALLRLEQLAWSNVQNHIAHWDSKY